MSLVFNPVDFDPKKYFPKWHKLHDGIRRFIGLLCERNTAYKSEWVHVHSETLRTVYFSKRTHKHILNTLVFRGIIEIDTRYRKGEYSKGYRLAKKYRNQEFQFVETEFSVNETYPLTPIESVLMENFKKLKVDLEQARNDNIKWRGINSLLLMINNKWYSYNNDNFGYRLFNNIVNLPKYARKYLSVDNEKLVNLDIANSQPLLLGLVVRDEIEKQKKEMQYNAIPPIPYNVGTIDHYTRLTEEGKLYSYLSEKLNTPADKIKKKLFSQWLFCKKHYGFGLDMEKLFPDITDVIVHLKKPDYKHVSKLLQRTESDIMIRGVCNKLMNIPDLWFAPIHDSILTTPDKAETVYRIIEDEFLDRGLNPTIRIEKCD